VRLSAELLFPYRRVIIDPLADAGDFLAKLSAITVQTEPELSREPMAEFAGRVGSNDFRLSYKNTDRDVYRLWLFGDVSAGLKGHRLRAAIIVHPFALGSMLLFFAVAQYMSLRQGAGFSAGLFVFMGLVHVALCAVGFIPLADDAEKRLRSLALPGEVEREPQWLLDA
jgi:hypothetical protein